MNRFPLSSSLAVVSIPVSALVPLAVARAGRYVTFLPGEPGGERSQASVAAAVALAALLPVLALLVYGPIRSGLARRLGAIPSLPYLALIWAMLSLPLELTAVTGAGFSYLVRSFTVDWCLGLGLALVALGFGNGRGPAVAAALVWATRVLVAPEGSAFPALVTVGYAGSGLWLVETLVAPVVPLVAALVLWRGPLGEEWRRLLEEG